MGGRGRSIKIRNAIGFGGEGFGRTAIIDGKRFDGAFRAAVARGGAGGGGAGGGSGDGGDRGTATSGSEAAVLSSLGNKGRNVTDGGQALPEIKKFSQKNIVKFTDSDGGVLVIKDDNGRTFEGTYVGEGASRVAYSFKEGFVIKVDGIVNKSRGGRLAAGEQNKAEVEAYKNLPSFLVKNSVTGRGKDRVPKLLASYEAVNIKATNFSRRKLSFNILVTAKGGHDTGIKYNSGTKFKNKQEKKEQNTLRRLRSYISAMEKRGVSDMGLGERNGNIVLHNIYRNPKNGRLTIVDLGFQRGGKF